MKGSQNTKTSTCVRLVAVFVTFFFECSISVGTLGPRGETLHFDLLRLGVKLMSDWSEIRIRIKYIFTD